MTGLASTASTTSPISTAICENATIDPRQRVDVDRGLTAPTGQAADGCAGRRASCGRRRAIPAGRPPPGRRATRPGCRPPRRPAAVRRPGRGPSPTETSTPAATIGSTVTARPERVGHRRIRLPQRGRRRQMSSATPPTSLLCSGGNGFQGDRVADAQRRPRAPRRPSRRLGRPPPARRSRPAARTAPSRRASRLTQRARRSDPLRGSARSTGSGQRARWSSAASPLRAPSSTGIPLSRSRSAVAGSIADATDASTAIGASVCLATSVTASA